MTINAHHKQTPEIYICIVSSIILRGISYMLEIAHPVNTVTIMILFVSYYTKSLRENETENIVNNLMLLVTASNNVLQSTNKTVSFSSLY